MVILFCGLSEVQHLCGLIWVTGWKGGVISVHWVNQAATLRVVSRSGSELGSSKVTHLSGCTGLGRSSTQLGESAQLLVHTRLGEMGHQLPAPSGKASHLLWLLHCLPLPEHPLLLGCSWLPKCWWLSGHSKIQDHLLEVEQWRHLICPSSIAAVANAWWWASLATLRTSSLDYCSWVRKELK